MTHFVWYLEKEKGYDIETLFIDGVLNKEHFYGKIRKYAENMHQKLVPDPFFFGKQTKTAIACKKFIWK